MTLLQLQLCFFAPSLSVLYTVPYTMTIMHMDKQLAYMPWPLFILSVALAWTESRCRCAVAFE